VFTPSLPISIHILNVGHGDSIVIECGVPPDARYVVIDTNLVKQKNVTVCPAFEFLKKKNVSVIDTLAVTHLDLDHYCGIEHLLDYYDIRKLLIPPFFSNKSDDVDKKLAIFREKGREALHRSANSEVRQTVKSLATLLNFIDNNRDKVDCVQGRDSNVTLSAQANLCARIFLPLPGQKGNMFNIISDKSFEFRPFKGMNDFSIAFCLKLGEHKVLLTGDATADQWQEHQRQMARDGINSLECGFVKSPHHGSSYDNTRATFDYMFGTSRKGSHLFVSAEGKTHPSQDVIKMALDDGVIPHCTSISRHCVVASMHQPDILGSLPPEIRSFVSHYELNDSIIESCHGDITLSFSSSGDPSIISSTGMRCIYQDTP